MILLFTSVVFSQKFKIIYGKSISLGEDKINTISNPNVKERVKRSISLTKNIEYELLVCNGKAEFYPIDRLTISAEEKFLTNQDGQKRIYNRETNEIFTYNNFMGKNIVLKDTILNTKWHITKDTMSIQNFVCYKAILEKEKNSPTIEAWFCPDFPFPFGPSYFYGLPGLVFKTINKSTGVSFYIKSISDYDCSNKNFIYPKEFVLQKDYELEIKKILQKSHGLSDDEADKAIKMAKESMRKNENK